MKDFESTIEYSPPLDEWDKKELIDKIYELGSLLHKEYEVNANLRDKLELLERQEEYSKTIVKLVKLIK